MSEPRPPQPAADRNLLFGMLALQLDFVGRDAVIEGMNAWVLDKGRSLGEVLCERGALSAARRALLDSLVEEHLQQHGGDARKSLESVTSRSTVTDGFAIPDPDVQSTVSEFAPRARSTAFQLAPAANGSRYRRLRPHARGGLGQVFVAEDMELHREVAVKEIQPERAFDDSSRTRFVLEAEITGALEHPGIVPVYGLGCYPDGRPYYAMRFIRGDNLKAAIDRYHAAENGGRPPADRALEFRALLRRFIDVCNAVAYAHSRRVIHRDLKPHNVMLGKFGETLVLDWGLAKVGVDRGTPDPARDLTTDPSVRPASGSEHAGTRAGSILGTPGYMSPEQAAGRIDEIGPASDVYSLGATLYCLLTGRKPFDRTDSTAPPSYWTEDLVPPRQVNPAVPAALDAVCRKAMAVRPADRYQTPLDLAAEVERWLADEPVGVYRDPWPVRAARWARRHRTSVAAGLMVLATAAVGLGLGSALLWREEQRTRHEYERAEREHRAAERNFETARTTILEMGRRVEDMETGQTDTRRSDLKRKAALDTARKEFERFVAGNPDDLVLKKQLAALHRYAGNVSRLLGDYAEAEAAYDAALALWDELAKREPGDTSHRDALALTLADAATAQKRAGRLRAAAATLERAATLAEEMEDRVSRPRYQRTLATTLADRADVEYRLGNFAAAERAAGRAVELYDALKEAPPGQANQADPIFAIVAAHTQGRALREMGKVKESVAVLNDAAARAEVLGGAKGGRDVRQYFNKARLDRAAARSRAGDRAADVVRDLGQVIEDADKLAADFPPSPHYKEVLASGLALRAELTASPGPAASDYDRALGIARELVDKYGRQPDHLGLRARAYLGKGRLLVEEGRKPEAGTAFNQSVTDFRSAREKDPENFHLGRGLEEAEREARANPKSPRP